MGRIYLSLPLLKKLRISGILSGEGEERAVHGQVK